MKLLSLAAIVMMFGVMGCSSQQPQQQSSTAAPQVVLETSAGNITLELNPAKAPLSVENFLKYVDDGFYNGTVFHRVLPTFMIQGGGFTPDGKHKATRAPIRLEAANGLSNARGTIAMARTGDPHSATSEFFINVVDNAGQLDPIPGMSEGYAVFGKVVEGMDVVDKIKAMPGHINPANMRDGPSTPDNPVLIIKAYRKK